MPTEYSKYSVSLVNPGLWLHMKINMTAVRVNVQLRMTTTSARTKHYFSN